MPIHVEHLTSEVIAETEPPPPSAGQNMRWQEVDRVRQALARATRDRLRTAAEGFDD